MDGTSVRRRKRRDPQTSRRQILDAAESVFAKEGYDGASLAKIARDAGVSTTLPTYFFGEKSDLYGAVEERLFARRDEQLSDVVSQALGQLDGSSEGLRSGLTSIVRGYLQFLLDTPAFVSLMSRDALERQRNGREGQPRHSNAFERGLRDFLNAADPGTSATLRHRDHLMVTIMALCFFPLEHDPTLMAGMGYRARSEGFIDPWVTHVIDLLLPTLESDDARWST